MSTSPDAFYKDRITPCRYTPENPDINLCPPTKRILRALQYYESLDIANNSTNVSKLTEFASKTYPLLLDDFIHIITIHNDDIDDIQNSMLSSFKFDTCNIKTCLLSQRHNRNRSIPSANTTTNVCVCLLVRL